jgi:hypothetical protein
MHCQWLRSTERRAAHSQEALILGIDVTDGQLFIAIASVERRSSTARIATQAAPIPEALDFIRQIVAGLHKDNRESSNDPRVAAMIAKYR